MSATLRPVAPSDLPKIHALQARAEAHDRLPIATPLEELEELLHDPHFDLAADARLVEVGGAIAAWGRIWHRPSGVREERAYVFGAVDPARRGAGLGRRLLAWQLARATAILRDRPGDLPRFVRTNTYAHQADALRLYARSGMHPVRYNDEMLRDLEDVPAAPAVEGITIVPWDDTRSEEARLAQNAAFADHWGSTPLDAAAWAHDGTAYGSRLDLSFLALEDGRVVGVCRNGFYPCDEALHGRRDGWIRQVSVARSHRGRGIASALIVASLHRFRSAGLTHSALGVDSENPTGAYALYERLGYRPQHRAVTHQIEVAPSEAR